MVYYNNNNDNDFLACLFMAMCAIICVICAIFVWVH
jgi:hypothetical protein